MVNVPSREAQARLVGVTSQIYEGHFRLVADRLDDPLKAYDIIERARGRAAADVLRTLPADDPASAPAAAAQERHDRPAAAPVDRSRSPQDRRQLLDQLWEAEQRRIRTQSGEPRVALLVGGQRAGVKALQQTLANDELVLEYVLSEPHSYCLVIGRSRIRIAKLASRAHIENLADRLRRSFAKARACHPQGHRSCTTRYSHRSRNRKQRGACSSFPTASCTCSPSMRSSIKGSANPASSRRCRQRMCSSCSEPDGPRRRLNER